MTERKEQAPTGEQTEGTTSAVCHRVRRNPVAVPCGDCTECLSPLPMGQSCATCLNFARCRAMFGARGPESACQFIPSRARFAAVEARHDAR